MKPLFLASILAFLVSGVCAQDIIYREGPPRYEIGLSLGMNFWRILDRDTSPLRYKADQETFKVDFNYYSHNSVFSLSLRGAVGKLYSDQLGDRDVWFQKINENGNTKDVPVRENGSIMMIRFNAGYHYLVNDTGSRSRLMTGIILSESMFNPKGFTRPGLMNLVSLNPSVLYQYNLSGIHKFFLNGDLPVLSCVTRKLYNDTVLLPDEGVVPRINKKSTTISSFGNVLQFEGGLGYRAGINSSLEAGVDYRYDWTRVKNPLPLKMTENNVAASVLYSQPINN